MRDWGSGIEVEGNWEVSVRGRVTVTRGFKGNGKNIKCLLRGFFRVTEQESSIEFESNP